MLIKTAILGASGYTGIELMKILSAHPNTAISAVTSRQYKGMKVSEVFPELTRYVDIAFSDTDNMNALSDAELVFTALPHGTSQEIVLKLLEQKKKVIDLSADFRLKDPSIYEKWYGEHNAREILHGAVYGLPELYRQSIKKADLIANPGCYPTSAILGLAPLLKKTLIDHNTIVIDSKSGISGAGRNPSLSTSFVEVNEGFQAYNVGTHRHIPEIEQELSLIAANEIKVTFIPHLLPISRGMLSTIYANLVDDVNTLDIISLFQEYYRKEPFIRVMREEQHPNVLQVRGSNFCDISVTVEKRTKRIIVITAIDNLIKGASGQAVQCMNIMCALPEETGLLPTYS